MGRLGEALKQSKDKPTESLESHADQLFEARRAKVVGMLKDGGTYALETNTDDRHGFVSVALAIAGKGSCEILIPKDRYDGMALMESQYLT